MKSAGTTRQKRNDAIATHPAKKKGLLALLATMQPLDDDDVMPVIEDFPAEPVDLTQDGKGNDTEPGTAGR